MRLLVVMDPPAAINPETDTTLVIIEEARRRDHTVELCLLGDLAMEGPDPVAMVQAVTATARTRPAITVGPPALRRLSEFAAVFMRKDPVFDLDYFFGTLLLEAARGRTFLVNDPRGIRDANEKLYIFNFPQFIAPTIVSRSRARLREFLDEQGGQMIVKPLDGCGGSGIFHVQVADRNTNAILETLSALDTRWVMAQRYLPEARQGDKRILLLDGEPIGAVLRVPRADETRGNLHVGGTAVRTTLTARERDICAAVGARCKADGLYFVGLDVIGDHLTEVNVTSPTGVREIDRLDGVSLEAKVIDWLERRVA